MQTFSEVIDELGGYSKVAELLGVPKGTVSAMKTRDSIPAEYWPRLVRAAEEQGIVEITFERLAEMNPPRRRRSAAPSSPEDAPDLTAEVASAPEAA